MEKKKKATKKTNKKVRLKGQLRMYMQWPVVMAVFLIAMNIWVYRIDRRAGILLLLFVGIYIVATGILYFYSKSFGGRQDRMEE